MELFGAAPQAADRSRRRPVRLHEDLLGAQSLPAFRDGHVARAVSVLFEDGGKIRRIAHEADRAGIDARHGGIRDGQRQGRVLDVTVREDLLGGHLDFRMIAVKRLRGEIDRFEPHVHECFGCRRPHLHAVVKRVHPHRHAIIGHIREADPRAVKQHSHVTPPERKRNRRNRWNRSAQYPSYPRQTRRTPCHAPASPPRQSPSKPHSHGIPPRPWTR